MEQATLEIRDLCLALLPYAPPFHFVDEIIELSEERIHGAYTFPPDADFYQGHFPGNPVTPGVILIECMAQIGLTAWGIFLTESYINQQLRPFAFVQSDVEFLLPVLPGERVWVKAEKVYFRFGKLKVKAWMYNENERLVCRGEISGMILRQRKTHA